MLTDNPFSSLSLVQTDTKIELNKTPIDNIRETDHFHWVYGLNKFYDRVTW